MFQKFFKGRYGIDLLSIILLLIVSILLSIKSIWFIGLGLLAYIIFRTLSKNIKKRNLEQQKMNQLINGIKGLFGQKGRNGMQLKSGVGGLQKKLSKNIMKFQQRKQYVFLKCPKCKKELRLPKNRGKLQVSCPVCKSEFLKET